MLTNFVRSMSFDDVAFIFFVVIVASIGFVLFSYVVGLKRTAKMVIAAICVAAIAVTGVMYYIARANYSVEYSTKERLVGTVSLIAAGEVEKGGGKIHGSIWYTRGEFGSESYYKFYYVAEDGGIRLEQFPAKDVTIYYDDKPRFESWQIYDIATETWFGETSQRERGAQNKMPGQFFYPKFTLAKSQKLRYNRLQEVVCQVFWMPPMLATKGAKTRQ